MLPTVQFCLSDKGFLGQNLFDVSHDETSMDHGLFSKVIEENSNNKSALFI